MPDPYLQKMAKLFVNYSTKVKEGDNVMIGGNIVSKNLLMEVYREVIKAGGIPFLIPHFGNENYIFYKYASDAQLDVISPFIKFLVENIDVSIQVLAETNPKAMSNINPQKISRHAKAETKISEIFMKRQATGELRWILGPFPTDSMAQEASMSLEEYSEFVYRSCLLDKEDPVSEWIKFSQKYQGVCDYLDKKSELRIIGKDTDLYLNIKGRKWINEDGQNNMPSGEVFTGPVEDSAEGTIRFTYPAIFEGNEVEDVKLVFKRGKVVEADATKGEALLRKMLKTDNGSNYLGEAAIGTNSGITKFTKNMLFDEKMGGTMHLALGAGYPETGSKNVSSIHWDMLKDMKDGGKIYADGELFYENGSFLLNTEQ
ncbi:MAG: aminopeptidase [Candidatus Methanofastidiosia archaeon]